MNSQALHKPFVTKAVFHAFWSALQGYLTDSFPNADIPPLVAVLSSTSTPALLPQEGLTGCSVQVLLMHELFQENVQEIGKAMMRQMTHRYLAEPATLLVADLTESWMITRPLAAGTGRISDQPDRQEILMAVISSADMQAFSISPIERKNEGRTTQFRPLEFQSENGSMVNSFIGHPATPSKSEMH